MGGGESSQAHSATFITFELKSIGSEKLTDRTEGGALNGLPNKWLGVNTDKYGNIMYRGMGG